jgi:hypothetical protein
LSEAAVTASANVQWLAKNLQMTLAHPVLSLKMGLKTC